LGAGAAQPAPAVGDMMFLLHGGQGPQRPGGQDRYVLHHLPAHGSGRGLAGADRPARPAALGLLPRARLVLFIAAAWDIENNRDKIQKLEFNTRCEKLAGRMCGEGSNMGDVNEGGQILEFFGRGSNVSKGINDQTSPEAAAKIEKGIKLIEQAVDQLKPNHEPGKAAQLMTAAYAIAESLKTEKRMFEFALNPEPLHTGQPSGGYADDPLMEQVMFRPPSVMSDSLTAFSSRTTRDTSSRRITAASHGQEPRRRGYEAAQVVGEIYASEEQLIELAREQLGNIRLREAASRRGGERGAEGQLQRGDERADRSRGRGRRPTRS